MPKSSLKRQQFNQKKPFIAAAIFCLILIVFAFGFFNSRVAQEKQKALDNLNDRLKPLQGYKSQLERAMNDLKGAESEAEQYMTWMEDRFYWPGMLTQLRDVLINVENKKEEDLKVKTGLWVEKMEPVMCGLTNAGAMGAPPPPPSGRGRRGGGGGGFSVGGDREICSINFHFAGKNLKEAAPSANQDTAYALSAALSQMEYFDTNVVTLTGNMTESEDGLTFGFDINVKLRRPIKF